MLLKTIIYAVSVVTFLLPVFFAFYMSKRMPKWFSVEESPKWERTNIISLLISLGVSGLAVLFLYLGEVSLLFSFLVVGNISVLSFLTAQMGYTDFKYRMADRRVLWTAIIPTLISGVAYFLMFPNGVTQIILYGIIFGFMSLIHFIPKVGQSDARALQLVVSAAYPIAAIGGLQLGFIILAVAIVSYGVYISIKEKNFKQLFTKLSLPMVPFIIGPFVLVIMILILQNVFK